MTVFSLLRLCGKKVWKSEVTFTGDGKWANFYFISKENKSVLFCLIPIQETFYFLEFAYTIQSIYPRVHVKLKSDKISLLHRVV